MPDNSANNKRVAKNTIVLYVRMIFLILINLYTSRLVLQALGEDDFGIYNVVGGFVTMFTILSGSLSNAIGRFLTFELGKNNFKRLAEVFSTSVTVQILLALGIVFIAEIIGIWFLNVKMNIPADRMAAANWVFQCSLVTFAINLVSIPYNASIIAHEHMKAFAYISILEMLLKLGVVVLLLFLTSDRLIIYGVLLMIVAISIRVIYGVYCARYFVECHYVFIYDKKLVKEMLGLASWNFLGSSGSVLNSHGVNLLMNLFFGIGVNAARGLAVQVNSAVTQFVNSFTTAVNPQITKSYAKGEREYMFNLVYASSKYSFFMMLLLSVPLIIEAPFFLKLWLNQVPEYTILFVRLTLIAALISTLSSSLYTLALATGNIKKYQLIVGSLSLSCFIITYICYKVGLAVEYAYYVYIIINILILIGRLKILSNLTGLLIKDFFIKVVFRVLFVSLLSFSVSYYCYTQFYTASIVNVSIVVFVSAFCTLLTIWFWGLKIKEKEYIYSIVKNKIKSINECNSYKRRKK